MRFIDGILGAILSQEDEMPHLRGLANAGIEINPSTLGDWPFRIGQFMLDFATIEFISYQYLNALEPTRESFGRTTKLMLGDRINRIEELVRTSGKIADGNREKILGLWNEVRAGSKWRNRIAHNALVWSWKKDKDASRDPPDAVGIPDMRQVKELNVSDNLTLEGVVLLIEGTVELGKQLSGALRSIEEANQ